MKAMVYSQYGPPEVVKAAEVEKPSPKDNQILVRVKATTVTAGDIKLRSMDVPTGFGALLRLVAGITAPRNGILGLEFAGEVEAIGKTVTQFKRGDRVFGSNPGMKCHAEYVTLSQDGAVSLIPENISFEEAAAVPFGALSSLIFLRDVGKIKPGQEVLINGASGGLGVFAVQLAKHFGARVTAVCSGPNLELVKSLGADHVIDYTKHDFTTDGEIYDLIFDTVGTAPFSRSKKALRKNGRAAYAAATLPELLYMVWASLTGQKKAAGGVAVFKKDDLNLIKDLIVAGKIKPVIEKQYPLDQIAEAHRHVDSGRKKGSVVITLT